MKKESPILKYTSILLIVLGAVEAAVSIRGFFDIPALHEAAIELQLANPVPVLTVSGIFSLLIALAELASGILGYRYRAQPKKVGACIPCGITTLSLTVLFNIYVLLFYPAGFSVLSLPVGLILPAVYLFGAYRHKNSGAAAKQNLDKPDALDEHPADSQNGEGDV